MEAQPSRSSKSGDLAAEVIQDAQRLVSLEIALAKQEPGKLNYASAGTGSGIHLGTEYFASMAGIKLTHIPYKGSAPALTDLVGGHVAIYFSSLPPAVALVKEGKVRALAVTGARRSPILPDVPTVAEAGFPGIEQTTWTAILAPARTPVAIVAKLNGAIGGLLRQPDINKKWAAFGIDPVPTTPQELEKILAQEIAAVPTTTRAMPTASAASTSAISRAPPPAWTGI